MALVTAVSRVTGFLRLTMTVAALGLSGVRQAFEVANNLPTSLYELLLGGLLSSTLVPFLVEARARQQDGGVLFTQRLVGLVLAASALVAVVAVLFAPGLVGMYSASGDARQTELAVAWARFFLPQIMFYGVGAAMTAVLNSRGRFTAPLWAPVLNNAVMIVTLALFLVVPGPRHPLVEGVSTSQFLVLGLGTTLGVVAMTAALLPALHKTGIKVRLSIRLRGLGLRRLIGAAIWTLLYVSMTQAAYLVLSRLATEVGAQPVYATALTVWQLPYAVVAMSVLTVLVPTMSADSVAGRRDLVRVSVDRGTRLVTLILLPAVVIFVVLGRDITVLLFSHGASSSTQAEAVGWVLALLAIGLIPYSSYQVGSRAFYAMRDARTPALIQSVVAVILIILDLTVAAALPHDTRVYGLAAATIVAYSAGLLLVRWSLNRLQAQRIAASDDRLLPRLTIAVAVAGLTTKAVATGLSRMLPPSVWSSVTVVASSATGGAASYLAACALLQVQEAKIWTRFLRERANMRLSGRRT